MTDMPELQDRDLSHAGSVVDKAIEYMMGQKVSSMAIASALLGGAMGVLSRSLPEDVIVQILQNAIASVESGEMRGMSGPDTAGQA
ncbi:MAG: hypothetical protein B7Z75_09585 [Acidocella sp. 20-57-95]|nr:MAG: hypothetical protein B7Z75_09585 [Acidocella sp. 20-57-95]OYV59526.1 MAG: hypothetical protein B7Z71_07890 [Acidocella sp. 21-58-7]HQT65165.1 hypothetical protein [Acidocella sp.]HQU04559.1 hypothetical protein [Acidocella sp.]